MPVIALYVANEVRKLRTEEFKPFRFQQGRWKLILVRIH
ncbi:hypothetical protein bcere0026_57800 [Bacillus mycoides]|uniref:Uncharacterized protein n=1 Tax=Bacillus mycoides TaxID=1405 RepID=C2Y465_BACMY|nr:hypothetical protein bcere0026_57800 [Bacillus mycoides]